MQEHRLSGGRQIRIGPWRGTTDIATLATYADQPLSTSLVIEALDQLRGQGYRSVITAALPPADQAAFRSVGFDTERELALLRRQLDQTLPGTEQRFRRWRRRDFDPIVAVDHAAFEPFWRFDDTAIRDALDATPHRTLRVNRAGPIEGYALSGVSRDHGYLQRLAVHPDAAGRGFGRALLIDALRWMRQRGALDVFVNTQTDNTRALALYESTGFTREPEGLAILHGDL